MRSFQTACKFWSVTRKKKKKKKKERKKEKKEKRYCVWILHAVSV